MVPSSPNGASLLVLQGYGGFFIFPLAWIQWSFCSPNLFQAVSCGSPNPSRAMELCVFSYFWFL